MNRCIKVLYLALIVSSIYLYFPEIYSGYVSPYLPAVYATGSPKIVLRPFNIAPGKTDQVTGINFTPLSTVNVTFAGPGNLVATTQVNSTGGFVAKFAVESNTPPGLYAVSATDNSPARLSAEKILSVLNTPKIVLLTGGKAHVVGVTITVNGSGFSANNLVTVFFNNAVVSTPTTDTLGNFLGTFIAPSAPAVTYYVNATDGRNNVFKTFVLNSHVSISPNSKVPAGTIVVVTGSGYSATSMVSFTFGGTPLATKIKTNNFGAFSVQITVPTVAKGSYQLAATDATGHSSIGRIGVSN